MKKIILLCLAISGYLSAGDTQNEKRVQEQAYALYQAYQANGIPYSKERDGNEEIERALSPSPEKTHCTKYEEEPVIVILHRRFGNLQYHINSATKENTSN
jgi:hypothetical protein